jgi:hypothetical protein
MKASSTSRRWRRETGAALLIAIFALMLVSVVAIALIVSSGTDSALAGNYRTSTSAYYAALAGLEEARGRLNGESADFINKAAPNFVPSQSSSPLPLSNVLYIINPASGESVVPTDLSNAKTYPDTEYQSEFGGPPPSNATIINSTSPVAGLSGQSYKWVRINAVTEKALNLDVNSDGTQDPATPLFYDPARKDAFNNSRPSLIVPTAGTPLPPSPATAAQALEITSLAVLPSGSRRMLQYVVAPFLVSPGALNYAFPAALTLAGNNASFQGPNTSSFFIKGQDQCASSTSMVMAIGTVNGSLDSTSLANIASYPTAYPGYPPKAGGPPPPPTTPSVGDASSWVSPNWQTPSGLDSVVQDITKNADVVINGNVTASSLPSGMSASNPATVVVNGDLDLTAWTGAGYGLLLVTGTLKYDPEATWEGLVLVIGKGQFISTKAGTGGIDGAVFVAQTRDSAGNLLSTLGPATFSQKNAGPNSGRGINYNSCIVRSTQGPLTYRVLSFREIALSN